MRDLVQARLDEISSEEFVKVMEAQGLAYGRINNTGEVATHPQMEYRHMWVDAVYPDGDKVKVTASPIKLNDDDEENGVKHMALVGEDTYEVLKDYCDEKTLHEIYGEFLDK